MTTRLAYLNGQLVQAEDLFIPVTDTGFMLGATVAEQLRTFGGELFCLDRHLDRLMRSLEIVGVDPGVKSHELAENARKLIKNNFSLIDPGDDLGLSIFVTPGTYGTFSTSGGESAPLVGMHTYQQPFHLWCDAYENGQSLVIPEIRQVPPECWPVELKCRSRMHYYLADQQARIVDPRARALLLDSQGNVTEASTANVVIYREGEGLISPPAENILPGISLNVVQQLAEELGIAFSHRELLPNEVASADEVLLCSTSPCLLPVTRLDGQPIGSGQPGRIFNRLLSAWSEMVGVDIRAQAVRFANR